MRWETTVWMSVVLLAATTALHLPVEQTLHTDQTSFSAQDTSTKQDTLHMINNPEELVISAQTKGDETENASVEHFSHTLMGSSSTYSESGNLIKLDSNTNTSEPGNSISRTSRTSETSEEEDSDETTSSEEEETTTPESGSTDNDITTVPESDTTNGEEITPSETEEITPDLGPQSSTAVPGDNEDQTTPEPQKPLDTDVATSTGRVRGHVWGQNKNILSYIDIKYGTFNNYFEAPVFPEVVTDGPIHDKKDHSTRCPQLQGEQIIKETDCLTLSIFKPFKAELRGANVLVHIHDGNFISGSANPAIYGPEYLVPEDIILVLPNYRLGPLGFLCLQNETAPGNAALKDLALALSWIKENIEKFGGDPENIAVSGEGTAGALAGYLALSPMSKKNVNKVIAESGSVLSHWAIDRNPSVDAKKLASRIPGSWESWQTIDIEELLVAARDIAWRPCFENNTDEGVHFMVETPWSMLQEDSNVTFMIGSAEYAGIHESLSHTYASIQQLNDNSSLLMPNDLLFELDEDMSRVGDKVKEQYFGEAITLANVKSRTLYYTDMAYLGPGIRTARTLANSGSTVYFYEFSFVGDLNRELEAVQTHVDGAVRGDIIGYLFFQEGSMPAEGSKEAKMIEQLLEFWTSFLETGTPKANGIEWSKFEEATAAQELWLSIGTKTAMKTGVHVERLRVWTDIYNEHFVDSPAVGLSSSVYTVLVLQVVFFITFFRNAWHFF